MNHLTFNHNSFLIDKAITFAHDAHSSQRRKYTGTPYIEHPLSVARLLFHRGLPESTIIAALLHDTVEDTEVTLDDVGNEFGPLIRGLVYWVTDVSKPSDGNRAARKALDREHIARAPVEAKNIKCADLYDNTKSIVRYDRDFARVYLDEKHKLLMDALGDADALLYQMALDSCSAGMHYLSEMEKLEKEAREALRYEKAMSEKLNDTRDI